MTDVNMAPTSHKHKDLIWIALIATLILAFSTLPNWIGYHAQTDELAYKGIFFDPQDYAVHISMLRAGMQGDWAYQFRFTTEPHQGAYTRLFYLAIGQINRLFRLEPALFFEISRWAFGYLALFTVYALTKRFFKDAFWQRITFLLAIFGSGLGWLQLIFGWVPGPITPIDFWLIDAYAFFGIALFPHFSLVTAMLCLVFLLFLDFIKEGRWVHIMGILGIAILTQFVNPIAFVLVDIALATVTIIIWDQTKKIDWKQFFALGLIAAAQLPLLIYNINLLTNDPTWAQFTVQNETLSPPPIYYLWGFGLLWLFALMGLASSSLRRRNPALLGVAAWVVTGFVLAYAHFAIQRRFLHGVTIPLAILATHSLKQIIHVSSQKWPDFVKRANSILFLSVFLISLSSIYLILGRSLFMLNRPSEFFYPASLNPALAWLDENAAPDDFVLSSTPSGQLIAQKTNLRVYIGHEMETLDFNTKSQTVTDFYNHQTDSDWLENSTARWVLYGPYERMLTGNEDFVPVGLETVYHSEGVTIYRVSQ